MGWRTGSPGHTSGTLGTFNAESTGSHVRVGGAAASASSFPNRAHLRLAAPKKTLGPPKPKRGKKGKKGKKGPVAAAPGGDSGDDGDTETPHPLAGWPALDRAIEDRRRQNAHEALFAAALSTIAQWGFGPLLDWLNEIGPGEWLTPDEGALDEAQAAAANYAKAQEMNSLLMSQTDTNSEDFQALMKLIALLNRLNFAPGLRDVARELGLSDLGVVTLWEKGIQSGQLASLPTAKTSQLTSDIARYRAGTYYFASGGPVPGAGNQDSVPAMLTPGEFVIKREAAKALGLGNLWALNQAQKFSGGGMVLEPTVSDLPNKLGAKSVAKGKKLAGEHTRGDYIGTQYNVEIHNPVAEKGTYSMMKMLQRKAALQEAGGGS